jgi:BlaI family penicillinase repressor
MPPSPPKPTDAELAILRVLWRHGPATVRDVYDRLGGPAYGGYTTALKLLQIMAEKGLVARDETNRSHVYRPRRTEDQVQRQLVRHLLDRAFGGSARKLVVQLLGAGRASADELREIRDLLDKLERPDAPRAEAPPADMHPAEARPAEPRAAELDAAAPPAAGPPRPDASPAGSASPSKPKRGAR